MAPGHTRLVLIIESAIGLLNMVALAGASPRVVALSLGGAFSNGESSAGIGFGVDL